MPVTRSSHNTHSHIERNDKPKTAYATCEHRRCRDGTVAVCTEYIQRGSECVDKPSRMLRRGRRIKAIEPMYGLASSVVSTFPSSCDTLLPPIPSLARGEPSSPIGATRLQPKFFASEFFRWFHLQFPLFDPQELPSRFNAISSSTPLNRGLQLINHTLMAWATSFGLDEHGCGVVNVDVGEGAIVKRRREASNALVRQCLKMVDCMGVLRKMSFDGARAVLLLMPLAKDVMSDTDRETMHHTALQQTYHLSAQDGRCSVIPTPEDVNAAIKRARLFRYAYVTEEITSSLQGKDDSLPLIFNEACVASFETSLSPDTFNASLAVSPIAARLTYEHTIAPTHVAETCRLIYDLFASCSGIGLRETLGIQLQKVWSALQVSWEEFDRLRGSDINKGVQVDRDVFVSSWQIFIFETYHTIQARLKNLLSFVKRKEACPISNGSLSSEARGQITIGTVEALLNVARTKCANLLPCVLGLICRHVRDCTPLFRYNAGILTDKGVFCAGTFLVQTGIISRISEAQDDFLICVKVLQGMSCKWAYSESGRLAEELAASWDASIRIDEWPNTSGNSTSVTSSALSRKDERASKVLNACLLLASHKIPVTVPITPSTNSLQSIIRKTLPETSSPLPSTDKQGSSSNHVATPGDSTISSHSSSNSSSTHYEYTSWARFTSASASPSITGPSKSSTLLLEDTQDAHHNEFRGDTSPASILPDYSSLYHHPSIPIPTTSSPNSYFPSPLPNCYSHMSTCHQYSLTSQQGAPSWETVDISSPEQKAALAYGVRLDEVHLNQCVPNLYKHSSWSGSTGCDPVAFRPQ
ncbi:hypothetical protein FRB94_009831 [Tulasnella sp. JGI-2019a]|nr:hypothetical protein FRB94_009831 [Tulasnella sp. JGI-2019a]